MASRYSARGGYEPMRRVSKIVQFYARKHEQVCGPLALRLIRSQLKKLDRDSYRLVLGLTVARQLDRSQFGNLMVELNHKQVDEDFSTPSLIAHLRETHANYLDSGDGYVAPEKLYDYIERAAAKDPLLRHLYGTVITKPEKVHERAGMRIFQRADLLALLNRYLYKPCASFLDVFGGLVMADGSGDTSGRLQVDEFIRDISYHTVRSAYFTCQYLTDNRETVMNRLQDESSRREYPDSLNLSTLYKNPSK